VATGVDAVAPALTGLALAQKDSAALEQLLQPRRRSQEPPKRSPPDDRESTSTLMMCCRYADLSTCLSGGEDDLAAAQGE